MQKRFFILTELSLLILLLLSFTPIDRKSLASTKGTIIELFTSEGCSSCPAADEAVAKIAKEYGSRVHVICYHVDYWDRLGWRDKYSSPVFTNRQKDYANSLQLNSIYTPQVIVNGQTEFVGSDEDKLQKTIKSDLQAPAIASLEIIARAEHSKQINISYKTANAENDMLHIVLIQTEATTNVKNGENEGRVLHHINIARKLTTLKLLNEPSGTVSFEFPAGFTTQDYKIIAFTQSAKTMQITGSAETGILP